MTQTQMIPKTEKGIGQTRWEILPDLYSDDPDYVCIRASMKDRHDQRIALIHYIDKYTYEEIISGNNALGQTILEEMWREFKRGLSGRYNSRNMFWLYGMAKRWSNHGFSL